MLGASVSFETAAFEIQKPYFALDEQNLFTNLGRQRYRGVEVSLTRQVSTGLSWVAGAMFLSPEVSAAAAQEPIGTRPVGQPAWITQLGVDYRFARYPRISLDCTIGALGGRMARVDNRAEVAGYGTVDLGVRYQVRLGSLSTTVRVQLLNATNTYNWYVGTDGGLLAIGPRRAWAYFVVDL
jgi:iron complex outermembrane receptor protein